MSVLSGWGSDRRNRWHQHVADSATRSGGMKVPVRGAGTEPRVSHVGKRDSADGPGGWRYSLWTGRVGTLSREEAEQDRHRPMVPVAWGVETEPGWHRNLALFSVAAAAVAAWAWRASGMRRIALAVTAGVLALPLLSFGAVLGLARALRILERETEAGDA
jgi:hypothetical protein